MGKYLCAWALVLLFSGVATAQVTGGSIGGGDWDSSGSTGTTGTSGNTGYSYTPSNTYTPDYSYSYHPSYTYRSRSGLPPWAYILIAVVSIGIRIAIYASKNSRTPTYSYDSYPTTYPPTAFGGYNPADAVDVSVLRIAIDGRARKFVQDELARIATTADPSTDVGRAATLREVSLMLRRLRDAWVYGGAVNEDMTPRMNAKAIFDRHVTDARARFTHQTKTNVGGAYSSAAGPDIVPRSDEGAGLILVTIVIAARTELFTVLKIGDGEDLRRALESAGAREATDVVALEVIWQPSEDNDRMSSMELEAKYPHPQLIKIHNALVGKTFCAYCAGPFPAELVSCPHCGAAARAA